MSSTPIVTRDHGSPAHLQRPSLRWIALALSLGLACAKGASRPGAPDDVLHYPAWIAASGTELLVVNLDQDMAYENGALVAIDAFPGMLTSPAAGATNARQAKAGVPVPNMAGQLLVVDGATAGSCAGKINPIYNVPFALVAGRFDDSLYVVPLTQGPTAKDPTPDGPKPAGTRIKIDLNPFSASEPFGVAYTCGPDGTPRAWVGFMAGQNHVGYVTRLDLSKGTSDPDRLVQVNVGRGAPRSFAYDAARDRLYFTGREVDETSTIRWIQVGSGCPRAAAGSNGVQDERKGGCHVDAGFDVGTMFRGAEPNDIALSSAEFPCTSAPAGTNCRRMYLSVRMYDADLAVFLGARPSGDVGGKLMVLELPEGDLSTPEPQVVADLDIGVVAGPLHVVPRPGKHDLVAVTAVDDALLWLYDDDIGAMVQVFGRDATGVPVLGRQPTGIASQDLGGGSVRLFVTSYKENWVSAVDVPLDDPAGAALKVDELTGYPWRLGVAP
jgi:hypothetical protein